ncbi:MAG: branched-chain amino acid aminotransferase [Gammaproteobacteria bacterium]
MLDNLSIQHVERSRLPDVDFDTLGFGGVYSDHMFIMDYEQGEWRNPRIVPYGPLPLAPGVASLHYSQSVFEGMKAFRGVDGVIRLFRPDMNAARLQASCERLCMPSVDTALFIAAIKKLVALDQAWIPEKRGQSLYIRPLIIGTEEHLDVRPSQRFMFIVMTAPVRTYYLHGATGVGLLAQDAYTRAAPGGTGYAKTGGNYAASLKPGQISREAGYDQALWLDGIEHRYVEEVGQMNIFFKFHDAVVTPELRGTILPGITRNSIITLLRERGITVEERRLALDEVLAGIESGQLEEAFGAGTAAVVTPVGRIGYKGKDYFINDNRSGPLTQSLYDEILAIQVGETNDQHGWIERIEAV